MQDLIWNGVQYSNEKKTFHKFCADSQPVKNIGIVDPPEESGDSDEEVEKGGGSNIVNDGLTEDDLALNDEDYNTASTLFTQAEKLTSNVI